jgi:hypothetical protein
MGGVSRRALRANPWRRTGAEVIGSFSTADIVLSHHHEAIREPNRQLRLGSLPENRRIFPARLNLAQHQVDELGRRPLVGERRLGFGPPAELLADPLPCVGGAQRLPL